MTDNNFIKNLKLNLLYCCAAKIFRQGRRTYSDETAKKKLGQKTEFNIETERKKKLGLKSNRKVES